MIVYIAFIGEHNEGGWVCGVYSTREAAIASLENEELAGCDYAKVYEWFVDGPGPKFPTWTRRGDE